MSLTGVVGDSLSVKGRMMQHSALSPEDSLPVPANLRESEAQLIAMLRLWHQGEAGQTQVWSTLSHELGPHRARACLQAFEEVLRLLRTHGWTAIVPAVPHAPLTATERDFARFVLICVEADREEALQHALFLVSPAGMLPLFLASGRLALPLLCQESRCRLHRAAHD